MQQEQELSSSMNEASDYARGIATRAAERGNPMPAHEEARLRAMLQKVFDNEGCTTPAAREKKMDEHVHAAIAKVMAERTPPAQPRTPLAQLQPEGAGP